MKNTPVFDDNDIIILDAEELESLDTDEIFEYEEILSDGDIPF